MENSMMNGNRYVPLFSTVSPRMSIFSQALSVRLPAAASPREIVTIQVQVRVSPSPKSKSRVKVKFKSKSKSKSKVQVKSTSLKSKSKL